MIEVEKNFDLKEGDKTRIIKSAVLLEKKCFIDVYYDTKDYKLTGKDYWLRSRNGKFELKVPLNVGRVLDRVTDQYKELETNEEIASELGLSATDDMKKSLREKGYAPFATITTTRERYKKGDFNLDFDEMDFGFTAFEVELMVQAPKQIPAAEKRILKFGTDHNIAPISAGKVIEYLRRYKPEHLAFLKTSGIA